MRYAGIVLGSMELLRFSIAPEQHVKPVNPACYGSEGARCHFLYAR